MPVSSRFCRNTPSISPTVGKFCTPGEPDRGQLVEEAGHQPERVGAADARQHRTSRTTGSTSPAMSTTIALASP